MKFQLHPNLAKKTFLKDLPLCRVLLEDEKNYPWLILVPRRPHISRMIELSKDDKAELMVELDLSQEILLQLFQPAQINVAAIGNKTPQLHIHVIARQITDPAWPLTVWDHPIKAPYSPEEKDQMINLFMKAFEKA